MLSQSGRRTASSGPIVNLVQLQINYGPYSTVYSQSQAVIIAAKITALQTSESLIRAFVCMEIIQLVTSGQVLGCGLQSKHWPSVLLLTCRRHVQYTLVRIIQI